MKIAFYDTKPYDKTWFKPLAKEHGFDITFFETKLSKDTAILATGNDAVMPIAAISDGFISACIRASMVVLYCELYISWGLCSTQPGLGYICGYSCWHFAIIF